MFSLWKKSNDHFHCSASRLLTKFYEQAHRDFTSQCPCPQDFLKISLSESETKLKSIDENVRGLVSQCVRSSLQQISSNDEKINDQQTIDVEIEYDPILGNVKTTRKRSTFTGKILDENASRRVSPLPVEKTPIWVRSRSSHSNVKPSDLVRQFDKKEKFEVNAFRRLSRSDLNDESYRAVPAIASTSTNNSLSTNKEKVLRWCQELTRLYKGIDIRNFSSSWADGLAFCAIVHRYFADAFNFDTLSPNEPKRNFDLAFSVALERAGIEPLIRTDDMLLMGEKPDSRVVFTYVQSLYRHLSRFEPPAVMRKRW